MGPPRDVECAESVFGCNDYLHLIIVGWAKSRNWLPNGVVGSNADRSWRMTRYSEKAAAEPQNGIWNGKRNQGSRIQRRGSDARIRGVG